VRLPVAMALYFIVVKLIFGRRFPPIQALNKPIRVASMLARLRANPPANLLVLWERATDRTVGYIGILCCSSRFVSLYDRTL